MWKKYILKNYPLGNKTKCIGKYVDIHKYVDK